eukprot:scaffold15648_cov130-Isochrysis_galbana.AAC.4
MSQLSEQKLEQLARARELAKAARERIRDFSDPGKDRTARSASSLRSPPPSLMADTSDRSVGKLATLAASLPHGGHIGLVGIAGIAGIGKFIETSGPAGIDGEGKPARTAKSQNPPGKKGPPDGKITESVHLFIPTCSRIQG